MKNNEKMFHVIVWGVCAVLAVALIILVYTDRKKSQERIIQAQVESQLQSGDTETTESSDSEYAKKASSIYADLISKMQLNSFVCWGDDGMAGNSDSSFQMAFGEFVNGELLKILSESFDDAVETEKRAVPPILVYNMGASDEGMDEILTRSGVDELEVGEWALITEERKPVNLVLRNGRSGSTLHFAQQKNADFGKVDISGVKGILTKGDGEYDKDHPRFAFVRDRAGDSFQVGLGTKIEVESATKYIGNVPIFFFEDDSAEAADSVDEFVEDLERLVLRYTVIEEENGDSSKELPYVLICTTDEESDLDESLKEAFGDQYIRNDSYADDMTSDNYKELAQKVYANLDGQGCFDEIKTQIEKAAEELKVAE